MTQNTITIIVSGAALIIFTLLLLASLRASRRQQEQAKRARAEREAAQEAYWQDMLRQMNAPMEASSYEEEERKYAQ